MYAGLFAQTTHYWVILSPFFLFLLSPRICQKYLIKYLLGAVTIPTIFKALTCFSTTILSGLVQAYKSSTEKIKKVLILPDTLLSRFSIQFYYRPAWAELWSDSVFTLSLWWLPYLLCIDFMKIVPYNLYDTK